MSSVLKSEFGAPLDRAFYHRDAEQVSRDLIGSVVLSRSNDEVVGGRIYETEAYIRDGDDANHGVRQGKTDRNESMFGIPGTIYVYLIYGIHHCLNVSVLNQDLPEAVLIRCIKPDVGVEVMRRRREENRSTPVKDEEIASGPGKLCQALGITRVHDGNDIIEEGEISIHRGMQVEQSRIQKGKRIGIDYADSSEWPLRFYCNDFTDKDVKAEIE